MKMKYEWIKVYHEARTDPKLMTLTWPQYGVWLNLLLFSSEQPNRGVIEGIPDEILALQVSRGDVALLNETLARLVDLAILEAYETCDAQQDQAQNDGVTKRDMRDIARHRVTCHKMAFKNFAKRQLDVTTLRQRKCRERKKLSMAVTPMSRDVTHVTTEGEGDRELKTPPLPAGACARETIVGANPPTLPSTPRRTPEDQAEVDAACALLGSTMGSEHLAMQIGQQSDIPGMVEIEGWKFHEAAKRLLDPAKSRSLRGNWKYYLGIVRGLRDDERPGAARAAPNPSANGHAVPRRTYEEITEDYAQRMREEREKNKPKVDPEYAKQLAQYNEIMRKFHERRL